MAILQKLKIRRDQLAEFIKDHDVIRQFERLFTFVNSIADSDTNTQLDINPPQTFDISAEGTVFELPALTGTVQQYSFYWTGGDGSNTFTMTTENGDTIGGLAAGIWIGEGNGNIELESDGVSDWKVKVYSDHLTTLGSWRDVVKGVNGFYTSGTAHIYVDNYTEANIYTLISTIMKTVGDYCLATGTYRPSSTYYNVERVLFTSSSLFNIRTMNMGSGRTNITFTPTATGNWNDTNAVAISFMLADGQVSWQ